MNDSKNFGKKVTTIMWWTLSVLPLIIGLVYFIEYQFCKSINNATDLSNYHINGVNSFGFYLNYFFDTYLDFIPSTLLNPIRNMLIIIGFNNALCNNIICWVFAVQTLHLIFDILMWVFEFIHKLLGGFSKC